LVSGTAVKRSNQSKISQSADPAKGGLPKTKSNILYSGLAKKILMILPFDMFL
jgi:hypothetical protein